MFGGYVFVDEIPPEDLDVSVFFSIEFKESEILPHLSYHLGTASLLLLSPIRSDIHNTYSENLHNSYIEIRHDF